MNLRISKSFPAAAVLLTTLSACQSSPTRLYTPYPVDSTAARGTYSGPSIRVDAVHVPPALDRIEIVDTVTPGELRINDLDHWSAPLGQVSRQVLSADLIARLPPGCVIFPHLTKPDGTLGLVVDILDFKADRSGASLQASWVLVPSNSSAMASKRGMAQLRTDQPGADAAATAHAWSVLLGQLADRIVATLTTPDS
jgi:uncharacterized protein